MPPKSRRVVPEEEVTRRWAALSLEQRQGLMTFDDQTLVDRVKIVLQGLFQKQSLMHQLGIRLCESSDPFAASTLFTVAFELTWQISRSRDDPQVVHVDHSRGPVLVAKTAFLERSDMFDSLKAVLPDMLQPPTGGGAARGQMSKARWKELFASEPSSVNAMEQQLVKLVEQALWHMATDPAYEVPESEKKDEFPQDLADSLFADAVPFESWMVSSNEKAQNKKASDKKKKNKHNKKRQAPTPLLETTLEEADAEQSIDQSNSFHLLVEENDEDREDRSVLEGSVVEGSVLDGEDSEDENVGVGTLHINPRAFSVSDWSSTPTATSTPVTEFTNVSGNRDMQSDKHASSSMNCLAEAASPGSSSTAFTHPRGRSSRKLLSPDRSPERAGSTHHMHPQRMVCYIWSQNAQLSQNSKRTGCDDVVEETPATTIPSTPLKVSATPLSSRGGWHVTGQFESPTPKAAVLTAVVRNTFVEIEDPGEDHSEDHKRRLCRSLSPSHLGAERDDEWPYHWHM